MSAPKRKALALTDDQFDDFIKLAWARVNEMDAVDRQYGSTPAYGHPEDIFIGTVLSAIQAGMKMGGPRGQECIADAYVMLKQRLQVIPRIGKTRSNNS